MRIENHLLKRLDHWRKGEAGAPSRTEAAHQRLERGLAARKERTKPALSDGEKLIAFMLADVMTTLDPERGQVANLVQRAIAGGHYWALDQEMRDIFHDRQRQPGRRPVRARRAPDMWDLLELSFEALSDEDRGAPRPRRFPTPATFNSMASTLFMRKTTCALRACSSRIRGGFSRFCTTAIRFLEF